MQFIAYKIICRANGKAYIGITKRSLHKRWLAHVRDARTSEAVLYRAMRHHGTGCFSIIALAEAASWGELLVIERGLIAAHGTYVPAGFNMTAGGAGMRAAVIDPDAIRRRGEKIKAAYADPEKRRQMSIRGKLRFSNPAEREKQRVLALQFARTTKYRTAASARQLAFFKDPAYVARLRAGAAAATVRRRQAN